MLIKTFLNIEIFFRIFVTEIEVKRCLLCVTVTVTMSVTMTVMPIVAVLVGRFKKIYMARRCVGSR